METTRSKSSDSFAPIELEEATFDLDDQTAELLGQRRHSLRIALVLGAVAFLGATAWMESIDKSSEYSAAASALHQIKIDGVDRFWSCAVPNTYPKVTNEAAMAAVIHGWSSRNPTIYAQYVQSCMPHLTSSESELASLALPNDLHREGLEVRNAMTAARSAWTQYLSFLTDPYQDFDADTARGHAFTIARTKTQGMRAFAALKDALHGD